MNKSDATQTAKAAAGKATGALYNAKDWLTRQFQKPAVIMVTGLALGAVAEYGVRKGMEKYHIVHKRTPTMH